MFPCFAKCCWGRTLHCNVVFKKKKKTIMFVRKQRIRSFLLKSSAQLNALILYKRTKLTFNFISMLFFGKLANYCKRKAQSIVGITACDLHMLYNKLFGLNTHNDSQKLLLSCHIKLQRLAFLPVFSGKCQNCNSNWHWLLQCYYYITLLFYVDTGCKQLSPHFVYTTHALLMQIYQWIYDQELFTFWHCLVIYCFEIPIL